MVINNKLAVAAIALAMSQLPLSAANAQTNINVSVAANFSTPLAEIITNFISDSAALGYDYSVTVTSGSTGNLEAAIITAGTSNTTDLFLAADVSHVTDLYSNHLSLTAGSPFAYARGYLELWTNTTGVDVSAGLPTSFTSLAIANPTTAPYGKAAAQVLYPSPYNVIAPSTDTRITEYSDITATYNAVNNQTKPWGFVAKSQICQVINGTQTFSGVGHYSYTSGYDNIIQDGIALAVSSRVSGDDRDTELTSFINYLQNSSQGGVTILKYCYTMS